MRGPDGYFWFVGRADDLIKIFRPPDRPVRGRKRPDRARGGGRGRRHRRAGRDRRRGGQGLCLAQPGFEPSEELEKSIRGHARKKLGPAVAPREIEFRKTLPKTRSGKIMRRLLKARELGLPEGDISTLETDES
jgi:acetyl-CoA synthetase